jgi:hypothetical protein
MGTHPKEDKMIVRSIINLEIIANKEVQDHFRYRVISMVEETIANFSRSLSASKLDFIDHCCFVSLPQWNQACLLPQP